MSVASRSPARTPAILRVIAASPLTLWCAFVLVHLWLGLVNLTSPSLPMGDVTLVYKFWMQQAVGADFWVGIDSVWVYPIVALVPMLLALAFGQELYASTWLSLVMILNAVAFGVLTHWGLSRDRLAVGWWWVLFLALLGPIALGRIDSVTVPLAIVALLQLAKRPRVAALLLTIATWIKVWPAAVLAAIVISSRHRGTVVLTAVLSSLAIVAVALAFGSGTNVLSFITQQSGRGLQAESPVSTIWLWLGAAGLAGAGIYYDRSILTFQMTGEGVDVASAIMTPLMVLAALAVLTIGLLANRRGATVAELLPVLSLALVTALIACNKVGSPQFIMWLAVPVILGLAMRPAGRGISFRVPAVLVLVMAALTQLIYPYLYNSLLALHPAMLLVITARNLLLFVLLAWAVRELLRLARAEPDLQRPSPDDPDWLPA